MTEKFRKIIYEDMTLAFEELKTEFTAETVKLFDIDDNAQIACWNYSIANFFPLFEDILDLYQPQNICEIGVDQGFTTKLLVKLCDRYNARVHAVDPAINPDNPPVEAQCITYFKKRSAEYLQYQIVNDLYIIDGEHTYASVFHDLIEISKLPHRCLIFLHDMSWPHSYRDVIMDMENYPFKDRPHGRGYLFPTGNSFTEIGMPLFYADAVAYEGGEQNGLLKAVEDFLALKPDWDFVSIPSIYGFGILWNHKYLTEAELNAMNAKKKLFEKIRRFLSYLELHRLLLMSKVELYKQNLTHESAEKKFILDEKDALLQKVNHLESVNQSLNNEKNALMMDINDMVKERDHLAAEVDRLNDRVSNYYLELGLKRPIYPNGKIVRLINKILKFRR